MELGELQYADSDGVGLAYRVFGDGPVDAVGVTNWATNLEGMLELDGWIDFIARLSRTFRFVVFDQRGSGLSDRVGFADIDQQVRDIAAVLDAAGLQDAVLFAADMSAVPALAFAARHPDRTRSLVMLNPVVHLPGADEQEEAVEAVVLDNLVDLVTNGWGKADSVFGHVGAPGEGRERDRAQVARMQRQALSPRDLAPIARTWLDLDGRPFCPDVRCPALVVVRQGDQLVSPEQGRWIARHVPDARLVELPGDDHFFFLGDRRALTAVIEEFTHGAPFPAVPDGRLVAAVLVDIVGSTSRAAEEGRAGWTSLLERYDAAVRDEVGAHGGRVVNTAGDSFLVLFDSAACGLRFASGAQRRAQELGLQLRAGVHVGEVDERDGGAVGLALHVVARVQALAEPGEVLVTGTLRDALLGGDVVFVPRGRRGLRGLPGRWSLFGMGNP